MAEPLARIGNFIHVYDFYTKPGTSDEFVRLFVEWDQGGSNPMHGPAEQVREGVLCRDENNPDHFYLLGEWSDKDVHRGLLKRLHESRPRFQELLRDGPLRPIYADVVA